MFIDALCACSHAVTGSVTASERCMLGTQSKMAAGVDAGYEETLEHGIRRAQTLLDKLQLTEAQTVYQEVLRLAAAEETPTTRSRDPEPCRRPAERATVAAVSGLAESFARQSRNQLSSYDDDQTGSLPWLRLNIQVITPDYL